jgi:hypothetical protein
MPVDTTKTMRRSHLLKGAAAFGALAALGSTGISNVTDTEAAGPSPVGAWMLTTEGRGNKSMDLAALTKDGLIIDAGGVPVQAPPKGQNTPITIGLGTWVAAAGGGIDVSFASLFAGTDGSYQGTASITAHVVLNAAGDAFKGPYKLRLEAGGKVAFSETGTVSAKRIKPAM